jgi:tRNA threonylcarbamoyl adenosine modification protein (Sua5/YciO/YrdC/YwlC family)
VSGGATPDARAFDRCMAVGGIVVFPSDTVYGLACDPGNRVAVERLYLLKRRPLAKPSAVMFFDVELALEALPELGARTREAMTELMPGGITVLLPNPARRFPLACGEDPDTLGIRIPDVPRLAGVRWPVLQSSANRAGGADPRRLEDVPELLRRSADLVIDGGELPGTSSTVVDLRHYDADRGWRVVRGGAVAEETLREALGGQWHFDPDSYLEMIDTDVPLYRQLQDELAAASGEGAARILELGTGTGETAKLLLERHPEAVFVGLDESEPVLGVARESLPGERVQLRIGRIQDGLPDGPFDVVASALCVHHLDGAEKAELFRRVHSALAPGGRFVLGDLVLPLEPDDVRTPYTPGFDKPDSVNDQVRWMSEAGFDVSVAWEQGDLAVIVGRR